MIVFEESNDVRLVQDLHDVEWVALSHCWGPAPLHPICTTTASLMERTECIPFVSLSRTFQDAAKITRLLGYRYLWIDSLCIIQNDKSDWEIESGLMAKVYGCSALTLCALSSENSTQGCRVNGMGSSRPENMSRYADFNIGKLRMRFFQSSPTYWHKECGDDPYKFEGFSRVSRNPLNTRAWTLQERELSPSKILFSENMLLWECVTMKASSELPWLERVFEDDSMPDLMLLPGETELARDGVGYLRDQWYSLIEDYSSRFMTMEADKLVAVRGIIQKYRQLGSNMKEVAGMWDKHLPASLLWQSWRYDRTIQEDMAANYLGAFYPRRPMSSRAPSWSWASIDGTISYQSQRVTANVSAGIYKAEILARVVSCFPEVETIASNSEIDAKLVIISQLTPVRFDYESIHRQAGNDGTTSSWMDNLRQLKSEGGDIVGAFFPDIVTEVQFLDHIFCLAVQREAPHSVLQEPGHLRGLTATQTEDSSSRGLAMGLALVKHSMDTYRRVGLIRWVELELFSRVSKQDCSTCVISIAIFTKSLLIVGIGGPAGIACLLAQ